MLLELVDVLPRKGLAIIAQKLQEGFVFLCIYEGAENHCAGLCLMPADPVCWQPALSCLLDSSWSGCMHASVQLKANECFAPQLHLQQTGLWCMLDMPDPTMQILDTNCGGWPSMQRCACRCWTSCPGSLATLPLASSRQCSQPARE